MLNRRRFLKQTMGFASAKNGAIIGHRWAKPATGGLVSPEKSGFANLTVERNHAS